MIKKTVTIEDHEWVIGLNRDRELHFSFQEVVRDEWAGLFWSGGDDDSPDTCTLPTLEDNVLPAGLSAVSVWQRLIDEIVRMINRHDIDFFYFTPSTQRKAHFYENMFHRYLPRLKGRWKCQVIDKTWFYFNKIK